MKLYITAFILILQSCSTIKNEQVEITGVARNAKVGAALVTEDRTYYLDRIDSWNTEFIDKEVMVI